MVRLFRLDKQLDKILHTAGADITHREHCLVLIQYVSAMAGRIHYQFHLLLVVLPGKLKAELPVNFLWPSVLL